MKLSTKESKLVAVVQVKLKNQIASLKDTARIKNESFEIR